MESTQMRGPLVTLQEIEKGNEGLQICSNILEVGTEHMRKEGKMLRDWKEQQCKQFKGMVAHINESTKMGNSLRESVETLRGPNGTFLVRELLDQAMANDVDHHKRMAKIQKQIALTHDYNAKLPIAKKITEFKQKHAKFLAEKDKINATIAQQVEELQKIHKMNKKQKERCMNGLRHYKDVIRDLDSALAKAKMPKPSVSPSISSVSTSSPPEPVANKVESPTKKMEQTKNVEQPMKMPKNGTQNVDNMTNTVSSNNRSQTPMQNVVPTFIPRKRTPRKQPEELTLEMILSEVRTFTENSKCKPAELPSAKPNNPIRVKSPGTLSISSIGSRAERLAEMEFIQPEMTAHVVKRKMGESQENDPKKVRFSLPESSSLNVAVVEEGPIQKDSFQKMQPELPPNQQASVSENTLSMIKNDNNTPSPVVEPKMDANETSRMVTKESPTPSMDHKKNHSVSSSEIDNHAPLSKCPDAMEDKLAQSEVVQPQFVEPKIDRSHPKGQNKDRRLADSSSSMRQVNFPKYSTASTASFVENDEMSSFEDMSLGNFAEIDKMSEFSFMSATAKQKTETGLLNKSNKVSAPPSGSTSSMLDFDNSSEAGFTFEFNKPIKKEPESGSCATKDRSDSPAGSEFFFESLGNDGGQGQWNFSRLSNFGEFDMTTDIDEFNMDMDINK